MANRYRRSQVASRTAWEQEHFRKQLRSVTAPPPPNPAEIGAELATQYGKQVINPLHTFCQSLRTKDEDKIRLAYAMHLFTRYPVPKRIQTVWFRPVEHGHDNYRLVRRPRDQRDIRRNNNERFRDERLACFFAVGAGQSPYKTIYKEFLSKKEVHRLLTCGHDLDYYRAIVWAIARTFTDDNAVALRIAQSKVGATDYHDEFWRDAVRFFAVHPTPLNEINDFVDFLVHEKNRNRDFSLKGRTLSSLNAMMRVWHRELTIIKRIGGSVWAGLAVDDWELTVEKNHHGLQNGDLWQVNQILTGKVLAAEGAAMHHCVYSYESMCMRDQCGIFSMTVKRHNAKEAKRTVTIEVSPDGTVVQVRGFANRAATLEEQAVLSQWASASGLRLNSQSYY